MKQTKYIHSSKINAVRQTVSVVMAAFAIFASTSLTSCVKDELFNTPHPDKGAVVFSADFSERSTSCTVPAEYLLLHTCCGAAEPCTMPGMAGKCHPELFAPGRHTFHAWNSCERITVTDAVAKVNETAQGVIESLPGYFFTAHREIDVVQDDTLRVNLPMVQRTRDLHFDLTVTEGDPRRRKSVTGTLTGIAGAFDLAAQQITGEAVSTAFAFTRTGNKLIADARLLGVTGGRQTLVIDITFSDGRTQTTESDLTEHLTDFGSDMTETFRLAGDLNTPIEADMNASINNWKPGNGGGEDADIK